MSAGQGEVAPQGGFHIRLIPALFTLLLLLIITPLHAQAIKVVAGGGTGGDGSLATQAKLVNPFATGLDVQGNLYISEMENGERILKVDKNGRIATIAGTGVKGFSGDGGLATKAQINGSHHLLVQPNGDILLADTFNNRIRKIDAKTGIITTIAGTGEAGFSGDGGLATQAKFGGIYCLALDSKANRLYACDLDNHRIRAINLTTGIVTTVAGNGKVGAPLDETPALEAPLVDPRAIALDSKGNLYIVERGGDALRALRKDGKIQTLIGRPYPYTPSIGALNGPKHLSVDNQDNVLIADTENNRIVKYFSQTGQVDVYAGSNSKTAPLATSGKNLSPLDIKLERPHGVYAHSDGRIYLADSEHGLVLLIPPATGGNHASHPTTARRSVGGVVATRRNSPPRNTGRAVSPPHSQPRGHKHKRRVAPPHN